MKFKLSDNVKQRIKEEHLEDGLSLLFPPVWLRNGKRPVCEPPSPPGTRPTTQDAELSLCALLQKSFGSDFKALGNLNAMAVRMRCGVLSLLQCSESPLESNHRVAPPPSGVPCLFVTSD